MIESEYLGRESEKRICVSNNAYNFSVAGHKEYEWEISNNRSGILFCSNTARDEELINRLAIIRCEFGTYDHTCRNKDVSNNNLKFLSVSSQGGREGKLKNTVEIQNLDGSAWIGE